MRGEHYLNWWSDAGGTLIKPIDMLRVVQGRGRTPGGGFFSFNFPTAMDNASQIHFNLKGIPDIDEAIRKGARGDGYTNTELYLILHNRDWYVKTKFYDEQGSIIDLDFRGN